MIILTISTLSFCLTTIAALIAGILFGSKFSSSKKKVSPEVNENSFKQVTNVNDCDFKDRYLSTHNAIEMITGYTKSNNDLQSHQQTKSIFMSSKYLNCYLKDMEQACISNKLGKEVSGIRMFLARHMKEETLPDSDHKVGQVTLILYPTFSEGKEQISFDPRKSTPGNIVKLSDLLSPNQKRDQNLMYSRDGGDESSGSDRGQASPPRHP